MTLPVYDILEAQQRLYMIRDLPISEIRSTKHRHHDNITIYSCNDTLAGSPNEQLSWRRVEKRPRRGNQGISSSPSQLEEMKISITFALESWRDGDLSDSSRRIIRLLGNTNNGSALMPDVWDADSVDNNVAGLGVGRLYGTKLVDNCVEQRSSEMGD